MKWLSAIRSRLGWKLFLSYLVVIIVGVVVLFGTARFRTTSAIDSHISIMHALLGDDPVLRAQLDEGVVDGDSTYRDDRQDDQEPGQGTLRVRGSR